MSQLFDIGAGAACNALKNNEVDLAEEERGELINLKRKLVLKKGDDRIRLKPQIHNSNRDDYHVVLAETGTISPWDVPACTGDRKLFRAYRYFQHRIDEITNRHGNRPSSAVRLNEVLMSTETWGGAQIDAQTTKLVNKAMNLFKLGGVVG